VAIVPFVLNALTHHANPLKLREYLAAGLPVASTAIPEAEALARAVEPTAPGSIELASSPTELAARAAARARSADTGPSRARSDTMAGESWDARVDELQAALDDALAARARTTARTAHGQPA
jgi:hypothetical protein